MKSKDLALGAIICALTVIMFLGANLFGTLKLAVLFLSTVFICVILDFSGVKTALAAYAASSLLAWIAVPDKTICIAYLIFFGNYAVVKHYIEKIANQKAVWTTKIACATVYAAVTYFFTNVFLSGALEKFNIVIFIAAADFAFIIGDIMLSKVLKVIFSRFSFRSGDKWR